MIMPLNDQDTVDKHTAPNEDMEDAEVGNSRVCMIILITYLGEVSRLPVYVIMISSIIWPQAQTVRSYAKDPWLGCAPEGINPSPLSLHDMMYFFNPL